MAIMNGLYNFWSLKGTTSNPTTDPAKDTVGWTDPSGALHLLDTKDPTKVYFTTRTYRYAPVGLHSFQIGVRRLPESFTPASPGIPTKYLAEKNVLVDIWVQSSPQQSIETAETAYFNMVQEIKRIIRVNSPNTFSTNFVALIITGVTHDEGALRRDPAKIHAQMSVHATDFEVS